MAFASPPGVLECGDASNWNPIPMKPIAYVQRHKHVAQRLRFGTSSPRRELEECSETLSPARADVRSCCTLAPVVSQEMSQYLWNAALWPYFGACYSARGCEYNP